MLCFCNSCINLVLTLSDIKSLLFLFWDYLPILISHHPANFLKLPSVLNQQL